MKITLPSGLIVEVDTLEQVLELEKTLNPKLVVISEVKEVVVSKPIHSRSAYTQEEKIIIAKLVLNERLRLGRKPSFSIRKPCRVIQKIVDLRPDKTIGAAISQAGLTSRIFEGIPHWADVIQQPGQKVGIQGSKEEHIKILSALMNYGLSKLPKFNEIVRNFGKPSGGEFQR